MKTQSLITLRRNAMMLALISVFTIACSEDEAEQGIGQVSEVATSEAEMDALFEDMDDLASVSLEAAESNTGGRIQSVDDDRLCDEVFSYEGDREEGTITLDFGDGCTDDRGNVRKGKIEIYHKGRYFMPGSVTTITLIDYTINDIAVEGTRTIQNITTDGDTYLSFGVTLEGGRVEWTDGRVATREVNRVRVWERATNPINDKVRVTGSASGTTRNGVAYDGLITEELVFERACFQSRTRRGRLPVSGTNVLTTERNVITMDFGDGECDREVTITVNGVEDQVTVD